MGKELGIDPEHMGWILSGFSWTYAFFQIPSGWLVDRIRPRYFYPAILILWSVATAFLGVVGSFVGLFALRLSDRRAGSAVLPDQQSGGDQLVSRPRTRRRHRLLYLRASSSAWPFCSRLLLWLEVTHGWRAVFFTTGIGGMVWGLVWWLCYRNPRDSRANAAEVELIETGGGMVDLGSARQASKRPFSWADLGTVFKYRKLWGVYIGQFAVTSCQWFFLTWFPTYLINFRHLSVPKTPLYVALPFVAAFVGVQLSGFVSDRILRSGCSLGMARKTPIILGLLLSSSIVGANFVDTPGIW